MGGGWPAKCLLNVKRQKTAFKKYYHKVNVCVSFFLYFCENPNCALTKASSKAGNGIMMDSKPYLTI